MRLGVLALQGAFAERLAVLARLGVDGFEIRKLADLDGGIDGLILPGGESTVMGRLLKDTGLFEPLKALIDGDLPVFGTCAGMILLAKKIENDPTVHFGAIGVTVRRNAYGRQLGSFQTVEDFDGIGKVPMTFIRAPYITEVEDGVRVLATVNGAKVAAECGNILVTSFHPELTDDLRVHQYFLGKVAGR